MLCQYIYQGVQDRTGRGFNSVEKYIIVLVYESYSSYYNTTSFPLKITQFTYKTFKCDELLKCSRCCKRNTFSAFSIGEEKTCYSSLSMYAAAPILFSLCVHSMEGDSSRTQISPWGMERWQRCMPRPLLFSLGHRKRNIGTVDRENVTFSAPWYLTSPNWCLVWNRQKEA